MAEAPVARGILRQAPPRPASRNNRHSWLVDARSALLGRSQPLIRDDVEAFLFRDAVIRLGRLVETSIALALFVFFVYLGTVRPVAGWELLHKPAFWVIAFLPLVLLDVRGLQFTVYLRKNQTLFQPLDWVQHLITATSEFISKVALCAYIMSSEERRPPLKLLMLPYALGYIAHFVIGYCLQPNEESVRPEGCNSVAWLITELLRLVLFVFVIMVACKADSQAGMYPWQTAFWPAWAIVIVTILVALVLLPICLLAIFRKSPKALILCWVVPMSAIFCQTLGALLVHVGNVLSYDYCPGGDAGDLCRSAERCTWPGSPDKCNQELAQGLLPFAAFFLIFGLYTTMLRRRLAVALHTMWYHAPAQAETEVVTVEVLPTPQLMFRITPTYYTRHFVPDDDSSFVRSIGPSQSASQVPSRNGSCIGDPSARNFPPRGSSGSKMSWNKNGDMDLRGSARGTSGAGFFGGGWGASAAPGDMEHRGSARGDLSTEHRGSARGSGVAVGGGGWAASPTCSMIGTDSVDASFMSVGGTRHHGRDHAGSVLSSCVSKAYSEIVEEENLCFVCYADVPNGILLECGHAGMCVDCAVKMMEREASSCPICRRAISQVLRIRVDKPPQHLFGNDRLDLTKAGRRGRSGSGSSQASVRKLRKVRKVKTKLDPKVDPYMDLERGRSKSWETAGMHDDLQTTDDPTERSADSDLISHTVHSEEEDAPASLNSVVAPLPMGLFAGQLAADSWGDQHCSELPVISSYGSNPGSGGLVGIPLYPAAAQRTAFLVEGVRCWTAPLSLMSEVDPNADGHSSA